MSDVQHVEDSDSPKISGTALFYDGQQSNNSIDREQAAQTANGGLNDLSVNVEDAQINSKCDSQAAPQYLPASGHSSSDSYSNYQMNDQKASCGSPESDFDDTNTENYSTESCLASENSRIVVDTIEDELPSNSKAEELSVSGPEPMWLEGDESVALWVKVSAYPNLTSPQFIPLLFSSCEYACLFNLNFFFNKLIVLLQLCSVLCCPHRIVVIMLSKSSYFNLFSCHISLDIKYRYN